MISIKRWRAELTAVARQGGFPGWLAQQMMAREWDKMTASRMIGVAHTTIIDWLAGKVPSPEGVKALAKVTETDELVLFKLVYNLESTLEIPPELVELAAALENEDVEVIRELRDRALDMLPELRQKLRGNGGHTRTDERQVYTSGDTIVPAPGR